MAAFLFSIQVLRQIVFLPLRFISGKYWAKYDGRGLNEPWFLSSTLAILIVTLFACFVFIKFVDKKDWSYLRFTVTKKGKHFFAGFLFSSMLIVIFTVVTTLFNTIELAVNPEFFPRFLFFLLILTAGLFALVVSEELIARGYILRTLETHFNTVFAIVASSLLFSLFHLLRPNASLMGFLNIFLIGCFLALLYVKYKSLWVPIGLHFGWNFTLWLFNFPISGQRYINPLFRLKYNEYSLLSGSKFGPEDSLLVTFFLVIFVLYLGLRLNTGRDV